MPLRRKHKSHNLHDPSPPPSTKRRRLNPVQAYSHSDHRSSRYYHPPRPRRLWLLLLPLELRLQIYAFLFPPSSAPINLCLSNDQRSPRLTPHGPLGPCSYTRTTSLHAAIVLSNTCRQLRAEIQQIYFHSRQHRFALTFCNLSPLRSPSHRRAWCLCAVALRRIREVEVRYTSLTIPNFVLSKGWDGWQRVKYTESREREGEVLGAVVGRERRHEYMRLRAWSKDVVRRYFERPVGRGRRSGAVVGWSWREVEELETFLKGLHQWCYSM